MKYIPISGNQSQLPKLGGEGLLCLVDVRANFDQIHRMLTCGTFVFNQKIQILHPGKSTWNLKITQLNRNIFQISILGSISIFQGVGCLYTPLKAPEFNGGNFQVRKTVIFRFQPLNIPGFFKRFPMIDVIFVGDSKLGAKCSILLHYP